MRLGSAFSAAAPAPGGLSGLVKSLLGGNKILTFLILLSSLHISRSVFFRNFQFAARSFRVISQAELAALAGLARGGLG